MSAQAALTDFAKLYCLDGTISLPSDTFYVALLDSGYAPRPATAAWVAGYVYAVGTIVSYGGRFYECVSAGTSGALAPAFNTTPFSFTTDNTVTWMSWGYMPPPAQNKWGDISSHEIAAGGGYTAGGAVVPSATLTLSNRVVSFALGLVSWTAASFTAHYAAVYKSGTANGVVNPLLAVAVLDGVTNSDYTPPGGTFSFAWPTTGTITWS